jgi:ATP-binding cassette subfamily B multidrug efflux pump
MIFRWFESLIDVFGKPDTRMPPRGIARFYMHYLRQAWPVLGVMCALGLAVALVEVALFDFLGRLVDLTGEVPAAGFFARHGRELAFMPSSP